MTETMFELKTFDSDTMLDHHLSKKLIYSFNQYFNIHNLIMTIIKIIRKFLSTMMPNH
jgi:hypothetical protein